MIASLAIPVIFANDWIEMVIGGIFFVIWIVSNLVGARDAFKGKPEEPVAKGGQPQEPVVLLMEEEKPKAPKPVDQAEALRNEIEDFVRRAQGKPPAERKTEKKTKPLKKPPAKSRTLVKRQPISAKPKSDMRREGVAEHVSKHISSENISAHASQLGQKLGQTDERMESRLHEKFDHKLGSLASREPEPQKKAETKQQDVAADIAAMLQRPEGMRQLIIANEILRRPEF